MTFIRTTVCWLAFPAAFILLPPTLQAQRYPRNDMLSLDSILPSKPIRVSKWILSVNPFGVLEPPAAIGFGIGYRLNERVELWSETSYLTNGFYQTEGPLAGIRQILQAKYFIDAQYNFFIAVEARYKSYQYRDKEDFYNSATGDSLKSFSNFSHHYFYGAGFQVGWRTQFKNSKRFLLELTAGLGFRKAFVDRHEVPPGYSYTVFYRGPDIHIDNLRDELSQLYFPGSLRLIYCFGKLLRP